MSIRAAYYGVATMQRASVAAGVLDIAVRAASTPAATESTTDSTRRLLEMESAKSRVLTHEPSLGLRQPSACSPRFRLPTSVTDSTPKPDDEIKTSWRDLLGHVREGTSNEILTDTFGWGPCHIQLRLQVSVIISPQPK